MVLASSGLSKTVKYSDVTQVPLGQRTEIFSRPLKFKYNHLIIKMVSCCPLAEFLGIKHKQVFPRFRPCSWFKVYVGIVIFLAP